MGEGKKKREILGGPVEGGPAEGGPAEGVESGEGSGGGSQESAQILDAPTKNLNTHRTDTPHHNATQHNTPLTLTTHRVVLGKGGSLAGKSMAQKTRHEQQIVPKTRFLVSRMVRIGLGTKRFDQKGGQKAVWANSGVGQKWCGPNVVRKTKKTWKKEILKMSLSPSPKTQKKEKNKK